MDENDTPKAPTPPRRKASTGPRKSTRATPPKAPSPATSEPAAKAPAKRATAKSSGAKASPTRKTATRKSPTAKAATAAKSAARKVGKSATSARRSVTQSAPVQRVADTREKMGDRNFFAALIGGAAAIGAAVGGLFYALRDGHPDKPGGEPPTG